MKVTKTEIKCDVCDDVVQHDRTVCKPYITLKGITTDWTGGSLFCDGDRYSNKFHICYQCLHDLGTLVNRLREEKKEAKDE